MDHLPLIAHWPLDGNLEDASGSHHGTGLNVEWTPGPGSGRRAALFNGRDSVIRVPDAPELQLGCGEFSVAAWIRCTRPMRGAFGDVLSKFDADRRCGLNLAVSGGSACYSSLSEARHVHFGIDDGYTGPWEECGRPGIGNPLVSCLTPYEGELYAGIADAATPEQAARVFRWDGATGWEDCGRLGTDPEHLSVMSMIVHDGRLYAGTGIWDWGRAEEARVAEPPTALTRVFRYEGGTTWTDLGQVGRGHRVFTMASFEGDLYVGLDRGGGGGCFKLQGETWVDCGNLHERDNFMCLMPLNGVLYGASLFAVYRYDGDRTWTCIGRQPYGVSQIHSFQVFAGKLHVGTWPQGYILRREADDEWTNIGLLGIDTSKPGVPQINEINALGVHNGKLYAGTIPKAQVYRYEADDHWTLLGSLASRADWDPEVCPSWMRVLTLTTHRGRLFACTGASQARTWDVDPDGTAGRVLSCQAGLVTSAEHDIGGDWTHIAAVRSAEGLRLYVNGALAHHAPAIPGVHLHLGNAEPLLIGAGPQSSFDGAVGDLRLYAGALDERAIQGLAARTGG